MRERKSLTKSDKLFIKAVQAIRKINNSYLASGKITKEQHGNNCDRLIKLIQKQELSNKYIKQ